MVKIRIDDALSLHNDRLKKSNIKLGVPARLDRLNKVKLGMKLYPDSNYKTIAVSISNLNTGRSKTVRLEWIQIICELLNVDANFLFGFPSKHDNEFFKIKQ
jgi:DNA-binding Xre family transcriptional regulator